MHQDQAPRVFVYTLAHDAGFAPNPFHGFCTLACCKPKIRARARQGDWVVGITPVRLGHRLAYAMRVTEPPLTFDQYFRDRRFLRKKPTFEHGRPPIERCGDSCYQPLPDGGFRQLPSFHYDDERGREDTDLKRKDLGGKKVLVSDRFAYFGRDAIEVPDELFFMMPGRFTRVNFTPEQRTALLAFLRKLPVGVHAPPRQWPTSDASWKESRRRCG